MHDTTLQSIGRTPLIRLRKLASDVPAWAVWTYCHGEVFAA